MRGYISLLASGFLIVIIGLTSVPQVYAWGLKTHKWVAEQAMEALPDESFFLTFGDLVIEYSIYPDIRWRPVDPHERYRHYYHVDESPDGVDPERGMLPWALAENYRMFVETLKAGDWERAGLLAGAVTHYATDVTMPLHTTSDYNPAGRHVAFEDRVDGLLHEITIYTYEPQMLDNVLEATVAVALESYGYVGYEPEKLNYWLARGVLWNDGLGEMTENRLNAAVKLTADIWYTALVEAGLIEVKVEGESEVVWVGIIVAIIVVIGVAVYLLRGWQVRSRDYKQTELEKVKRTSKRR
jgi:hypothetical protein